MEREALKDIGFDYAAGLLHFAGKEEMYLKYLKKYNADSHLQDAITAYKKTDYEEMLRQVYALKGLSGTLGFSQMFRSAAAIVTELRREEYQGIEDQLGKMQMHQKELLLMIDKIETEV